MANPWKRVAPSPAALLRAALVLALLVFLVNPILHQIALETHIAHIWARGHLDHFLSIAKFAVVVLAVVALARIELPDRRAQWIALGCLCAFVIGQIVVVTNHRIDPYNDFKTQWETAIDYVNNGITAPDRPQKQRALPLYYPLVWLFGSSRWVYLVGNIVVTTATAAMTVWIARRAFGWAAAAKTATVLVFGYEAYLVNTLPSHEVPGAFGAMLFVLLLLELDRQKRAVWIYALATGMGLTIAWTQWARGTGVFCALALVVYAASAIVRDRRTAPPRVIAAVLGVLIGFGTMRGLGAADLVADPPATHFTAVEMNLLAFGGYDTNGHSADKARKQRLIATMTPEMAKRVSAAMFPETLRTGASAKYENYLERTRRLLRFGNADYWYFRLPDPSLGDPLPGLSTVYTRARKAMSPIWWTMLVVVTIAGVLRREVAFDPRFTPLLMVGAFLFVMCALAESQGRYAYVLVFLTSMYAGSPWLADPFGKPQALPDRFGIARGAFACLAVVATVGLILAVMPHLYSTRLANFTDARVTTTGAATAAAEQSLTTIQGGPGTVTLAQSVEARGENTLHVVVSHEAEGETPGAVFRMSVDGTIMETLALDAALKPHLVSVPDLPNGVHDITIEVNVASGGTTTIGYLGFY